MIHIFVINHFAGNSDLAKNLREHLAKKTDLRYFVFNTVHAGFEKEIVKKVIKYFADEKLRFYCCGGSGTMRNMLDGIADLANVEVAFFPCGLTNDFLKSLGGEEAFRDIDKLIDGKVIDVDYIKTTNGVAINTLSFGCDTNVEKCMREYRSYEIFGAQLPYIMSVLRGIVLAKPSRMELTLDGVAKSGKYAEVVIGNGCVLGGNLYFCEKNDVTDGVASYISVTDMSGFKALGQIIHLMNKRIKKLDKKAKLGKCKEIVFRSLDGNPLYINFDGELVECGNYCKAEIVQKGLHFVVPQSVECKEFVLN